MSVGGVWRIGWRVAISVAVLTGVDVAVGNAVIVEVGVGRKGGVPVGSSISGIGATCATGVQAPVNRKTRRKRNAMGFKGVPPGDEVGCCFNGHICWVVPDNPQVASKC